MPLIAADHLDRRLFDITDPLEQAVTTLTDEYGALFVIAAGNDGPGAGFLADTSTSSSASRPGPTRMTRR